MGNAIDEMVKDGKKQGEIIGKKQGEMIGEKRGVQKGEDRLGQLISRLLQENRFSDAAQAAENARIRRRLYREYGI